MAVKNEMKTYLVSHHLPTQADGDWPVHARVRASTATRAIAAFHSKVTAQPDAVEAGHTARDFPVVEVKVVA